MSLKINTSIPVTFESISDTNENSMFLKAKAWVCHTGLNLNNSIMDKSVIEAAIPTLANIPVLGFIKVDNLNQADFAGHETRIIVDENGVSFEYLGRAYGIVPETNNAQFETKLCEDGVTREFLTCEILLWRKFSESIDIIESDGVKGQSMELQPTSVEGKFNKDKKFVFSKLNFEGLCILGDDVSPAMRGSIIEKFNAQDLHFQTQEMLSEFNMYYTSQNLLSEGGEKMNEKLELFAKFETLTDEEVAELKENIEQYSFEELEQRLQELVNHKDEHKSHETFSLTAQQMGQQIRTALSSSTVVDRWGDSVREYWYIDHDESRVYAEDTQNGYSPVGLNYSVNGDFVTVDFDSKRRIKFVPQDMEGEVEVISVFVSAERNEYEVQKVTDGKTKLEEDIQELTVYKYEKDRQEKMEIVNKFGDLTEDEIKPIIEKLDHFSVEDLEKELFIAIGKKGFSLTTKNNKETNIFTPTDFSNSKAESNQPEYLKWVDEFKTK